MVFRFPKTLDPITLFHNPNLSSSVRILTTLKEASATASATATDSQASDYSSQLPKQRGEFQLESTTENPTTDQLRSILEFVSNGSGNGNGKKGRNFYKPSQVVLGAKDKEDALRRFKEDPYRFVRPITVDWTGGRAVVGDNESEILNMVRLSWPED